MPKQKTASATKKRFKITGTGKFTRRHAMQAHKLEKKSAKRKRDFARTTAVHASNTRALKKLFGGRKS